VQSGSEGEDWKCRSVFGRVREGVGGIASRGIELLLAGVMIVRPRLLIFRRGGVGGFTKAGDTGAMTLSIDGASATKEADATARPSEYGAVDVLTARFFRFRAFFAGVEGLWSSKKVPMVGWVCGRSAGLNREASMVLESGETLKEAGVSGDVPGDDSVIEAESKVDTVVVGEESEDSEAEVDVLSRGW
jgi:hypothetical protein